MRSTALLLAVLLCGVVIGCAPANEQNLLPKNPKEGNSISSEELGKPSEDKLSYAYVKSEYILPFSELVYCSDFSSPQDIPGHMLLNWYREYINNTKTPDERKKLYTKEGVEGYIYPAIEFENYVKHYFDLSAEFMQGNPTFEYDSTNNGYSILGGARGEDLELLIDDTADISEKDGVITIHATLANSDNVPKAIKELKILTLPDGSFRYLSYKTID